MQLYLNINKSYAFMLAKIQMVLVFIYLFYLLKHMYLLGEYKISLLQNCANLNSKIEKLFIDFSV